jgi:hypothetical protein
VLWTSPRSILEELGLDMPFPLRVTRTTHVANPEDLRKRAVAILARDLAALSGRRVTGGTLGEWEAEIAKGEAGN